MHKRNQTTPRIALLGNPNTGKTTLFNMLTGLSQRTGNFPGCTVEKKTGTLHLPARPVEVIDLPGTYSLAAMSPDELVVAETLLNLNPEEKPVDAVLIVADAACLHRNLYLLHQLRDLDLPMVLALNMIDQAGARGIELDTEALAARLGFAVVATSAGTGQGLPALKQALQDVLDAPARPPAENLFPHITDAADALIADLDVNADHRRALRHLAFRALIDEEGTAAARLQTWGGPQLGRRIADRSADLIARLGRLIDHETRVRYAWVSEVLAGVQRSADRGRTFSDKIDVWLTHPVFGLAGLVLLMAVVFQSIYSWAAPLMDSIDGGVAALGGLIGGVMPDGMLRSLVVDGIVGGVGGVLVFLPQIIFLFGFIAVLEDCGYMARAAFLMDRLFRGIGLSGKSLIPMLSSFACAVPGLMATRTIEDRRDRFATILVAPFMSCSARLPVYAIMIAAFIPVRSVGPFGLQGLTLLLMYCVGLCVAVPTAWLLKRTMLRGVSAPFLMELPSYKMPSPRTVGLRVFLSGREFLMRAGTTILAVSIVVWALAYFPRSSEVIAEYAAARTQAEQSHLQARRDLLRTHAPNEDTDALSAEDLMRRLQAADAHAADALAGAQEAELEALALQESGELLRRSFLGRMGHAIEPVVAPLGWDWRIGMATLASFPAREIIVATLGVIFNLGDTLDDDSPELRETLRAAVRSNGTPLFNVPVALSIMVFFALCAQCVATLAVIKKETGGMRYPLLSFAYMTTVAYVAAFLVYQGATALGW